MEKVKSKIREYCIKTEGVYKYGLPALLFLFLIFTLFVNSQFYQNNYWWIDIWLNVSLVCGFRELRAVYHYRKCEWQELTCYALILLGITNLIKSYFIKDCDINSLEYIEYVNQFRIVALIIIILFLIKIVPQLKDEIKEYVR